MTTNACARSYAKMCFDCARDNFIEQLVRKCSEETYAISFETLLVFREFFDRAMEDISIYDTIDYK